MAVTGSPAGRAVAMHAADVHASARYMREMKQPRRRCAVEL